MAIIIEDYVSFETAKLLKEKGFNCSCEHQYINCSSGHPFLIDVRDDAGCYYKNSEIGQDEYSAPTQSMAMKWLREVHNHNIVLNMLPKDNDSYVLWTWNVCSNKNYKILWGDKQPKHNTYEQAAESAILYCLENLI